MGVIFMKKHLIWKKRKCVHIHSQTIDYHTGKVHYNFVPNVHVLIFLNKKEIINIPTQVLQINFTFIV